MTEVKSMEREAEEQGQRDGLRSAFYDSWYRGLVIHRGDNWGVSFGLKVR